MNGDFVFDSGERVVVEYFAFFLDGVEVLAFCVEVMEEADDRHFCLVELLALEQIAEQIEGVNGAEAHLCDLVAALHEIGDQIEVLDEVEPGCGVSVFGHASLIELSELVALRASFVQTSCHKYPAVLLAQLDLVERPRVSEHVDEVVEHQFLVVSIDCVADYAEQSEDLEVLFLVVLLAF